MMMYYSENDRITIVINGYFNIIEQYNRGLITLLNNRFHLAQEKVNVVVKNTPTSLHNLIKEPLKALHIVLSIKDQLNVCKINKKSINSNLLLIIINDTKFAYKDDLEAQVYIGFFLKNVEVLINDANEFSPFTYF